MSTVRTNNILDASGGNTATINSMTPTADSLQGFRNRIINGDMRIDQRNAGAAVTVTSSGPYTVDRFYANKDTSGATVTAQQSSTALIASRMAAVAQRRKQNQRHDNEGSGGTTIKREAAAAR